MSDPTPEPEPITLQTPGTTIAGLAWGPADGLPVLAVHGWLDNANSFALLAPLLPDVRLVAIDLPGHGLTPARPAGVAYHFIDWVVDVAAALDALGWERCGLLGHSMGAGVMSLLAGTLRERFSHLVLIEGLGPMSCPPEEAPARLAQAIQRRASRETRRARSHPDAETAAERLRQVNPTLSERAARLLIERGTRPADDGQGVVWRSDPRLRGTSPMRMTEAHVHAYLRRVACPTLLVRGREGFAFDMKSIAARFQALQASGAPVRVEELAGGHHLHLQNPEALADLLRPFLRQDPSPPWLRIPEAELSRVSVSLEDLRALESIKLLVLDCDGVLTTGALDYGPDGTDRYTFNVKDGMGIKLLQRAGIEVALISGRSSVPVAKRCADLGITRVHLGIKHKLPVLDALIAELGLSASQVAYMGDDLNDLPCIRRAGYSAAPGDARREVRLRVRYVTGRLGGQGAVRELAEHILKFQGKWAAAVADYEVKS